MKSYSDHTAPSSAVADVACFSVSELDAKQTVEIEKQALHIRKLQFAVITLGTIEVLDLVAQAIRVFG